MSTPVRGIRTFLFLALALALTPVAGAAQETEDLPRLLDTLSALWQRGDAGALVQLGAGSGLALEIHGDAVGPVTARRAAAALRHLFHAQETVAVRQGTPSRVAGTDNRAFAEMIWEFRPSGATMSETATIFVGFVREPSGWKVSQIRILP